MRTGVPLDSLTIANGQDTSSSVKSDVFERQGCVGMNIQAPATLDGTVLTVQMSLDGGTTFADWQSPPGTDITVAAGKAITVAFSGWDELQVKSDSAESPARTILIRGVRDY